jgi:hypothetical protein
MSDSRVEGDYDLLDEAAQQLSSIAGEIGEVVQSIGDARTKLEEAWPDRVGTDFAERVGATAKTLGDIRQDLEDKSQEARQRAEQMRAVHDTLT